jgi:hypothetical protein
MICIITWGESDDSLDEYICSIKEGMPSRAFNGKVIDLYKDGDNHAYETVKIISDNQIIKFDLTHERNNIFGKLNIEDSVVKRRGTLDLKVIRLGKEQVLTFKYDCE